MFCMKGQEDVMDESGRRALEMEVDEENHSLNAVTDYGTCMTV